MLRDIKGEVKVLEFKVFQREGISDPVNAYVFNPVVQPEPKKSETVIIPKPPIKHIRKSGELSFINKNPKSFTFRGETIDVTNWQNILINICEIMSKRHRDKFNQVILSLHGTKHRYFSDNINELTQVQPKQIPGTHIYAATKLHANAVVDRCKLVIESFGYNPDDLQIKTLDS